MILLSGYHRLPQGDMYWEKSLHAVVPQVYKMLKNHFREIKQFLHLNDNSKFDKAGKMYKVRLFFQTMGKEFF
jgi:hypothetical protein